MTITLLYALLAWASSFATIPQTAPNGTPPTADEIRAQIEALQAGELPNKEELLAPYRQALLELERAQKLRESGAEFDRMAAEAPALLATLQVELAAPLSKEAPQVPADTTLRGLEQAYQQADANRLAAQKDVDDLALEAQRRSERRTAQADEIARVRNTISDRETVLRADPSTDLLAVARQVLAKAELAAAKADLNRLESERLCYEARRELLPLRRDRAQRRLAEAEFLVQFWQNSVTIRRQEEANAATMEAERQRQETTARFPELSELARRNAELAALRSGPDGTPARIDRAEVALLEEQQLLDETERRFRATKRKVAVGGLSDGMGLLLRREYEWTRPPNSMRVESQRRKNDLSRAQLLQIELEEERLSDGDTATQQQRIMEKLGSFDSQATADKASALVLELLGKRRSLRDALIDELGTLISALIEHERVHQSQREAMVAYREYIEERVLWVPSSVRGVVPSISDTSDAMIWLFLSPEWPFGGRHALESAIDNPGRSLLFSVLLLGLVLTRRRVRRSLFASGQAIRSYRTDSYRHTVNAMLLTIVSASPFPAFMWVAGWFLAAPVDQVEVAMSVGNALKEVGLTYFALEFIRHVAKQKGLGEAHFRWHSSSMAAFRSELRWFIPVVLPLDFLSVVFENQSNLDWADSAGRIAFVVLLVALSTLLFRLLRPDVGVLANYYQRTSSILERTHRFWFWVVVVVPVGLLILSLVGYNYSAIQLSNRFRDSLSLGIGLLLLNSMLLRWLFVVRRKLAVEQARQRARAKAGGTEGHETVVSESGTAVVDEESIDIPAVDAQTRQLIRSGILTTTLIGLFFIWADVFPALRAFDRVHLWPKFEVVDAEAPATDGVEEIGPIIGPSVATPAPQASSPSSVDPEGGLPTVITLADLALSLVILALVTVLARNAPGVLEISILQRLPIDSGSRYAFTTIFRYVILFAGLAAALDAIGIGWSKIQWLAAALTFGLGFGLQEIFANFVSGIIILIERPIRVGDIVTVGNVEGRVTRLQMRATTILDWDRRELLIPNKEFITTYVINWTLSDAITREVISVGVAYGSDTARARALLLQVAKENELVLDNPAPSAIFRGFGDSSLNFQLRVFLGNRDYWPQLVDRIHSEIDKKFRAAGIEIAFPTRDLHIRTAEGLRGLVHPTEEEASPTS